MREEGTRPASLLSRKRYSFRSAELAALFDMTWKRKKRLGIKTIAAPETPADVIEAAKARRRQRDQKYRHDQRRRLGMKPQAQSGSRGRPSV
jgi:hypothetical protein